MRALAYDIRALGHWGYNRDQSAFKSAVYYSALPEREPANYTRFRGHRDKVFLEPDGDDATTEGRRGVQA
jgi:hypothetical protein